MRRLFYVTGWLGWVWSLGCSSTGSAAGAGDPGVGLVEVDRVPPGRQVSEANYLVDPASDLVSVDLSGPELGELGTRLSTAREQTAASLAQTHAVPHIGSLGYDPRSAAGLDLILASPLGLNSAELDVLAARGFVILPRHEYPSFSYGYSTIYAQDLPVFISADMVLEAVHRSFDAILAQLESDMLLPALHELLAAMRQRLTSGDVALAAETANDLDVYLAVGQGLLAGVAEVPTDPDSANAASQLFAAALSANGEQAVSLFGTRRLIDFSQFKPRGHYADSPALASYFRAMMWLGRTDFRLIETLPDGSQVFRPRQLQAALGLKALMDDEAFRAWQRIDQMVGMFVGEHDDMTLPELDALLEAVGVADAAALGAVSDERIAAAITAGQFGEQRIASQIVRRAPGAGTFPLDASFAFFGQRYTVDSHVFSNLVYDRVAEGQVARVVPNPLDVAFAAFGNDQAVSLLSAELGAHDYAGDLAAMRALVDAHPQSYWQSSLYTAWLSALRSLSPAQAARLSMRRGCPKWREPRPGAAACSTRSSALGRSCATTLYCTRSNPTRVVSSASSPTPTWTRIRSSFTPSPASPSSAKPAWTPLPRRAQKVGRSRFVTISSGSPRSAQCWPKWPSFSAPGSPTPPSTWRSSTEPWRSSTAAVVPASGAGIRSCSSIPPPLSSLTLPSRTCTPIRVAQRPWRERRRFCTSAQATRG